MSNRGNVVLEVEGRTDTGKNACRRLRVAGRIPGNVYGLGRAPFMVAVDPKSIEGLLRLSSGANTVFTLTMKGQEGRREAMIKELQRDPVSEKPIHVDFVRIDVTRAIQVKVPIRLIGSPIGVRLEGGILDFVHREVEVECLPGDIPEHADIDVTELHLNQHVSMKNLSLDERVKLLGDPEEIVAVVVPPKVEEVAAAPAEGEAAAPAEGAAEAKPGEGAKPDSDAK
jgi:large subunit ribosomal protein L25